LKSRTRDSAGAGLDVYDPELFAAIAGEESRQQRFLELIASENYVSKRVLAAQGSCLTNKYANGYPGARTYSGCEYVDVVENLARERACELFGAAYANVQPYSGTQANAAAYAALMRPGERMLGMRPSHGGHITHGSEASFASRDYDVRVYGVDPSSGEIDYAEVEQLARAHRPKVIVAGFSSYPRVVDWARFRAVADDVGAFLIADMAHAAGLVAAGIYPSPVPFADLCTSTTHKTLRGPRGGMILARESGELAQLVDKAVYPLTQGGPLMHVIAAKAAAFYEAAQGEFAEYQRQVLANARTLAAELKNRGVTIVTGGTDNHMVLVDLRDRDADARATEDFLERAHIAVNAIGLPGAASGPRLCGLRLGTAAVTTRGLGIDETRDLAGFLADVIDLGESRIPDVRAAVLALCERFPVYARNARA